MAKTKQHLSTSENSVLPKTALTLSEPLMNIVITDGQDYDHFRPAFPLTLAATANANFDRAITVPINMDAWDDYLLAYSDIDINAVWLTTGTMGAGSCCTLRVKK